MKQLTEMQALMGTCYSRMVEKYGTEGITARSTHAVCVELISEMLRQGANTQQVDSLLQNIFRKTFH